LSFYTPKPKSNFERCRTKNAEVFTLAKIFLLLDLSPSRGAFIPQNLGNKEIAGKLFQYKDLPRYSHFGKQANLDTRFSTGAFTSIFNHLKKNLSLALDVNPA